MAKQNLPWKVSTAKRLIGVAQKKGLIIGSVEVEPDGTVRVLTGPPDKQSHDNELDKWLGEHPDANQVEGRR